MNSVTMTNETIHNIFLDFINTDMRQIVMDPSSDVFDDLEKVEALYKNKIKEKIDAELEKLKKKSPKKVVQKKVRRGRSPRLIFGMSERKKIKEELPEMDKKEVTKEVARRWKRLQNSEDEEDVERLQKIKEESKKDIEEQNRLKSQLGEVSTVKKRNLYHCWLKKNTNELKSQGLRGADLRQAKKTGWATFKANASTDEKNELLALFNDHISDSAVSAPPVQVQEVQRVVEEPLPSPTADRRLALEEPHSTVDSASGVRSGGESKSGEEDEPPQNPFYDERWYKDDEEEPICDILDPYSMSVAKLKWHLKKRDCKTTGRKKKLAKRLAKEMDRHHSQRRTIPFDRHTFEEDDLCDPKVCIIEELEKSQIVQVLQQFPPLPGHKPSALMRLMHTQTNIPMECIYEQKDFILSVYKAYATKEYMTDEYFNTEYGEEYYEEE